ncbi:MAG: cytochrome b/b6 domain-containing protein [Ignavibacteria bacterium]|nr:cytochrome b/b6 domain-containing protein [Ignavibacteria bacterium]
MKKKYLYPFWLRFWHWFNALLFLLLIFSGLSIHFSDPKAIILIPFDVSIAIHNISGIVLSLNYLFYLVMNLISGNYKNYIPKLKNLKERIYLQARYYLIGIFIGEPHPFETDEKQKFNPLQQISYFFIMGFFMPIIIISGWLLMFPELAPDEFLGLGGVWPMALLHTIAGYILTIFMVVHIYLGTTGKTLGELYKSMLTGWHLSHEEQPKPAQAVKQSPKKKRILPIVFYNPITLTGTLISILSFVIIVFLIIVEFFTENPNPYLGIVTFVVLPTFFIFGLILVIVGALKENRRLLSAGEKVRKLPVIDFNNPKHQVATIIFSVGGLLLLIFTSFGTYKAYEYTDSDQFCGEVCHKVMEPYYVAYKESPHSRVGCVKCHIGPGADWFVKSKLSGTYQVFSTIFNLYSRPIPTPVENLRPAQETCEQCHWPKHFYNEKNQSYDFFTSDEKNSEYQISMSLKVGGGSPELGISDGIHWHMYLANEITYWSPDPKRQIIPWVKSKSLITGEETVYLDTTYKFPKEQKSPPREQIRRLDCIDCHNRPTHIFHQPNQTINKLLSSERIDKTLPYIKSISVQVLENYVRSRKTAFDNIKSFVTNFYKENYPDIFVAKQKEIEKAISELHKVYMRNYFPDMKANWKNYPDNIGHLFSPGCFRCHEGNHISTTGKVIANDCNVCHIITYQKAPNGVTQTSANGLDFLHPGGIENLSQKNKCYVCHGPQPQKPVFQPRIEQARN